MNPAECYYCGGQPLRFGAAKDLRPYACGVCIHRFKIRPRAVKAVETGLVVDSWDTEPVFTPEKLETYDLSSPGFGP
jgi:hypothetical protein